MAARPRSYMSYNFLTKSCGMGVAKVSRNGGRIRSDIEFNFMKKSCGMAADYSTSGCTLILKLQDKHMHIVVRILTLT
jgi:hypothetical protein